MNHPMRKRYNNGGSSSNNNGSSNRRGQSRGGSNRGSTSSGGGSPRPRKNFRALQEKFLNQAKDAMASGDRILAEYYLQHADHYFRENEVFLAERAEYYDKRNAGKKDTADQQDDVSDEDDMDDGEEQEDASGFDSNSSSLPAFITSSGKSGKEGNVKVVNLQEWDD